MKNLKLKAGLALVACMGISVNASAQEVSCADLMWNAEVTNGANAACKEVVMRDGGWFAKMEAEVAAQHTGRTAYSWVMPDGGLSERQMADHNNVDFVTMIDGKPVKLQDLAVKQRVNVYLGDAYWSLPAPEPVAVAVAPEPEPVVEPEPMPEPEPAPVMLPKTGSQLNWLAVIGGLFLLLGGAARFARK